MRGCFLQEATCSTWVNKQRCRAVINVSTIPTHGKDELNTCAESSGLKAAQKAGDMLGIFSEKVTYFKVSPAAGPPSALAPAPAPQSVDSGKPHHSFYYPTSAPDTPAGPSLPSYFPDLIKPLPSKANSVKVQNFRRDQVSILNLYLPLHLHLSYLQDYLTLVKKCSQAGRLWEVGSSSHCHYCSNHTIQESLVMSVLISYLWIMSVIRTPPSPLTTEG